MSNHVPSYQLPDFAQSVGGYDADMLEIVGGYNRFSGTIAYRHPETGQTWVVPNIPCNQPREVQAEYLDFCAERHQGDAKKALSLGPRYHETAKDKDRLAKIARAAAAKLRAELSLVKSQ